MAEDKTKILIVDDEEDLVFFLKLRLEKSGYQVITAFDGQTGFEVARKEKPDLIILDLLLPEIDGFWVCDMLKKDARYSKIPVIILSAKAEEANINLGKKCGADEYMTKPFEFNKLLSKIEELI